MSVCLYMHVGCVCVVVMVMLCPLTVLERDTCHMQIPKGHNPRKQGWKDVVCGRDTALLMNPGYSHTDTHTRTHSSQ